MNWISYPDNKPSESGAYVSSITKPYLENNDFTFNNVSYYNVDNDTWYKYDSFNSEVLEKITDKINGWVANLPNYLG
ncbi:hypothetical protein DET49_13824 [Salegentibacter sp. 24]|uniref:hypothetical protein n=1 Tax=Salegentibacter sp. 24 TaxID=2183986 RepID=UPI00105FEF5A|nr:hypothetical protein [Salegentibacter sp. 24]TDN79361.1 hypothetical protein DET49_13824 [Salegentibacter sp. 24]